VSRSGVSSPSGWWIGTPIPVKMHQPEQGSIPMDQDAEGRGRLLEWTPANKLLRRFGEGQGLSLSPLVTYASPAAGTEQMCSPVNIALHERAQPVSKIEVQRDNALSAHHALIGLHQQIVPRKCCRRNESALDHNVVVGETGQRRCHQNAIAYEG